METITLDHDIKVFYTTAKSFPDGIMDAYGELFKFVPPSSGRIYYGLSRPENGGVIYKAAVEETYPGEAEKFNLKTLIIKKGNYISSVLTDWMKDTTQIGRVFTELIAQPGLDPEGYCVEWYFSEKDVRCMVRLNN